MANSAALVTDAFPRRELGRALGINAMIIGVGQVLGPILGGWLTSFGWRTVFWFNVPIGIVGTIAAAAWLVEQVRPQGRRRFDVPGTALCIAGLTGLTAALGFGGIYGWSTWWIIGGFVTFLVALPAFVMVERRREDPLLDLGLFKNRLFAMGNLTSLLNGIARNGVLFLLVFYLQGVRGFDPVTAGHPAGPARDRAARPLADQRRDRRPVRLADPRDRRDGRDRRRTGRARAHDLGRHADLAAGAVAAGRRCRVGAVRLAEHERRDGRRARGEAGHGRRRADDADPGRVHDLDRARPRARDERREPCGAAGGLLRCPDRVGRDRPRARSSTRSRSRSRSASSSR